MDYVGWNSLDPEDLKARAAGLPAGEKVDPDEVKPHPIFGDRAVRRALARAIDVDQLIRAILTSRTTGEVYGRPAVGTITPALCGVHNDDIARLTHDAAAARTELAGLGWEDHDGDGILDKGGTPFRFTLLINSGNARREKAAILIQAQLRRVGVDARVDKIESNTFFERLRKKDYEAALAGWSAALFVDPSSMWGRDSEFNFTSYRNPRVAELMDQGLREPDPARAQAMWKELQAILYEDQPYAFLYWMDEIVAVHGRFRDVSVDILSPYGKLWRWWVPPEQVKYRY
jgi:peptide/nickel transport system substrate-binding protein